MRCTIAVFLCALLCFLGFTAIGQEAGPAAAGSAAPPPGAIPPRPDEPRAAKAYAVLEAHCARCHQTGRLERPLASGGLANILAIDELARDPVLVKPGLPDASRLYDVLETRHAPLDVFSSSQGGSEPLPEEIGYVRGWIKDLAPEVQACPARQPVRPADIDKLMRDAQRLERDQGRDVRFISLVHLYNACAAADEMAAYRQALNKLMNSLSHASEPAKLTPLDAAGTVFSFRLSEFGWTAAQWTLIAGAYPPALVRQVADDVTKTADTKVVIVNGDWLAAAAAEAPLYYQILGIPSKLADLAKLYGTDLDQNIRARAARRIALRASGVTRGNRLIERHPGSRGGLWLIYDFATSKGEQDVFEHPEGPKSLMPAAVSPFKPDQIRALFTLANGFYAFTIFDAEGNRIDRVLPGIEKPFAGEEANAVEPATAAGANCFACHSDGLIAAKDEFRASGLSNVSALSSPGRETVLPLFGNDSENMLLMIGSSERYRAAAKAAGIDLGLRIRGEELVSGLARRYREEADFEAALSETGLERQDLVTELANAGGEAAPLARRLLHGVLSRPELNRLFELLRGIDAPRPAVAGGFLRENKSEIGLSMWIDKPRPQPGDVITIKAEADTACYLTVISVDAAGLATVLFPNDFEPDNLLAAGVPISIPGPEAPFQLRYKAEGSETLLGRCSTRAAPPVGIEHDFERQRFTVLGNWETFISDTLVTDWEMRSDPRKAERARVARSGALRRSQDRGERIAPPRPDVDGQKLLRDGRAVLVLGRR